MKNVLNYKLLLAACTLTVATNAYAEPSGNQRAEKVDIDALRKKYWTQNKETQLDTIQNRLYSKAGKIELGVFGGIVSNDPFLDVKAFGFSLGYHFNEYIALNGLYWSDSASKSTALSTFENANGYTVNSNWSLSYMGGELVASPIYGKLSIAGKAIIYYDMHALLGFGMRATESGTNPTFSGGIGQQIYLMRNVSLRLDYRLLRFDENIVEKVKPATLGKVLDTQTSYSNVVTLGATYLIGL